MNAFYLMKNLYPYPKWRKIRNECNITIVMNQDLTISYLNETSGFLVNCIDGTKMIKDILDIMLQEYEVDKIILENDICNVIRNMQWENIIGLSKTPRSNS